MQVQPVGPRILAKKIQEPEEKRGLLYVPPGAQDVPQLYEVVAVGQGRWEGDRLRPCVCKAGDKVLISKYTGNFIALNGTNAVILREEDILGIVTFDATESSASEEQATAVTSDS